MMRSCPKCQMALEAKVDADFKERDRSEPVRGYLQCPNCLDTFPVYDRKDEGEA